MHSGKWLNGTHTSVIFVEALEIFSQSYEEYITGYYITLVAKREQNKGQSFLQNKDLPFLKFRIKSKYASKCCYLVDPLQI
jgi:hypothetical protein